MMKPFWSVALMLVCAPTLVLPQDTHHAAMNERGDQVMGFSQEKTTHHFRLFSDGGAIEVTANDAKDAATRDQIRAHLRHITRMFGEGNFEAPMLVHGRVPPGVPALERLKAEVAYRYEDLPNGGRVRITIRNLEARSAIHDFLKFQIADHRTGDTTAIAAEPAGAK